MTWTIGTVSDGPHRSTVQSDGKIVRTYERVYQLQTDSGTRPTESDIAGALGIYPGSPFDNDALATANEVEIGPGPAPTRTPHLCYHVGVKWATDAVVPANTDPSTMSDPTTRRTLWSVRTMVENQFITEDKNKVLITNSAGQPFDGGVSVNVRFGQAVARRNIAAAGYNKNTVMANSGKVNSVTYLGGAPGTVQVDIDSEEQYEGAAHFWAETYTFAYKPLGHNPLVANVGFYQKSLTPGIVVPITIGDLSDPPTSDAGRVNEPEPLYDAAAEIADPTHIEGRVVPYDDRPGGCSFVEVDYFDEMDFTTFGL